MQVQILGFHHPKLAFDLKHCITPAGQCLPCILAENAKNCKSESAYLASFEEIYRNCGCGQLAANLRFDNPLSLDRLFVYL